MQRTAAILEAYILVMHRVCRKNGTILSHLTRREDLDPKP